MQHRLQSSLACCTASEHGARRGNALVVALIVVTVIATLGAGYLRVTSSLATRQSAGIDKQRAFYIAEAGLAESFQAVRMGRTGVVGSEVTPAIFGDGLVWVTATETVEGNVRLESTAMCGTGRVSLALIVQPVPVSLGFFSDEDLVIDEVILIDGFDSTQQSYEVTAGRPMVQLVEEEEEEEGDDDDGDDEEYLKFDKSGKHVGEPGWIQLWDLLVDSEKYMPLEMVKFKSEADRQMALDFVASGASPDSWMTGEATPARPPIGPLGITTGSNGLLGSNGAVRFATPLGTQSEIWGDVRPGAGATIEGAGAAQISGETAPRAEAVELPVVKVPSHTLMSAVRHEGLIPMLIPMGTSGYEQLTVAADAELIVQGPATLIIGSLTLEPGASLDFDTRGGNIALYILESMDLQPGSIVANSEEAPEKTTIQVAEVPSDPLNPAVMLDATAQFHGVIYAPDADVRIGSNFEVFGGAVARRLQLRAGARLHFDHTGVDSSAIPRIMSWRLLEVPTAVRSLFGDPFRILGVDRGTLSSIATAHDLASVTMSVEFVDLGGTTRTYNGTEDQFDWHDVLEVVSVTRTATRAKEAGVPARGPIDDTPAEDARAEEPAPGELPRAGIEDAIADMLDLELKDYLIAQSPLSDSELTQLIDSGKLKDGGASDLLAANSPLSDRLLSEVMSSAYIDKGALKNLLVANSPLSPTILAEALALPSSVLTNGLKNVVQACNE